MPTPLLCSVLRDLDDEVGVEGFGGAPEEGESGLGHAGAGGELNLGQPETGVDDSGFRGTQLLNADICGGWRCPQPEPQVQFC
jgi:hypothetical protein